MHTSPDIDALLEAWFEGQTTLEEERILKAYFCNRTIGVQHRYALPVFEALEREKGLACPLQPKTAVSSKRHPYWAAAAAVLLLLSAAIWWWSRPAPLMEDRPAERPVVALTPEQAISQPLPAAVPKTNIAPKGHHPTSKRRAPLKSKSVTHLAPAIQTASGEEEQTMADIKQALSLLSTKLNKGRREAQKGLKQLEQLDKSLNKVKQTAS